MKLTLILGAQGVILDNYSNNFSAFNIIEEIASPSFPVLSPPVEWLLVFERDCPDEQTLTVTLSTELNREQIHEVDRELGFGNKARLRLRMSMLPGFSLSHPGKFEFIVKHGDKTLGSYSIRINSIGKVKMESDVS